jgi:hypothetical protein
MSHVQATVPAWKPSNSGAGISPDLRGKLKPSRWRMTEQEAQARYPGCTRVEGSLEVRQFEPDGGRAMDAGLVRRRGAMTSEWSHLTRPLYGKFDRVA